MIQWSTGQLSPTVKLSYKLYQYISLITAVTIGQSKHSWPTKSSVVWKLGSYIITWLL